MVAAMGGGLTFAAFDTSSSFIDDSAVDSDIVLALKKMVKRDPTTKLKALSELMSCFEDAQRSEEDIAAALPLWQQSFARVSSDLDRRVREGVFNVLRKLVARGGGSIKKQLSKQLKDIIFPLLCARFDTENQVRAAANAAFTELLPAAKVRDAYLFCRKDIIEGVEEHFKSTADTLGSGLGWSVEEGMDAEERALSSAAHAFAHVLEECSGGVESFWEDGRGNQILKQGNSGIWRLLVHKSALVRSSSYVLIVAMIEHAPSFFGVEEVAAKAVYKTIATEKDQTAISQMWDMVLLYAKSFPEAWAFPKLVESVEKYLVAQCSGLEHVRGSARLTTLGAIPILLQFILKDSGGRTSADFAKRVLRALWGACEGLDGSPSNVGLLAAAGNAYKEILLVSYKDTLSRDSASASRDLLSMHLVHPIVCATTEGKSGGAGGMIVSELVQALVLLAKNPEVGKELVEPLGKALEGANPRLISEFLSQSSFGRTPCHSPGSDVLTALPTHFCSSWVEKLKASESEESFESLFGVLEGLSSVVGRWGACCVADKEKGWDNLCRVLWTLLPHLNAEDETRRESSRQGLRAAVTVLVALQRSVFADDRRISALVGSLAVSGSDGVTEVIVAFGSVHARSDGMWGSAELDRAVVEGVRKLCGGMCEGLEAESLEKLVRAVIQRADCWLSAECLDSTLTCLAEHISRKDCSNIRLEAVRVCHQHLSAFAAGHVPEAGSSTCCIARAIFNLQLDSCPDHALPASFSPFMPDTHVHKLRSAQARAAAQAWHAGGQEAVLSMMQQQGGGDWAEWIKQVGESIGAQAIQCQRPSVAVLLAEQACILLRMTPTQQAGKPVLVESSTVLTSVLTHVSGACVGTGWLVFVLRLLHVVGLPALVALPSPEADIGQEDVSIGWPIWEIVKAWAQREADTKDESVVGHGLMDAWEECLLPWLSSSSAATTAAATSAEAPPRKVQFSAGSAHPTDSFSRMKTLVKGAVMRTLSGQEGWKAMILHLLPVLGGTSARAALDLTGTLLASVCGSAQEAQAEHALSAGAALLRASAPIAGRAWGWSDNARPAHSLADLLSGAASASEAVVKMYGQGPAMHTVEENDDVAQDDGAEGGDVGEAAKAVYEGGARAFLRACAEKVKSVRNPAEEMGDVSAVVAALEALTAAASEGLKYLIPAGGDISAVPDVDEDSDDEIIEVPPRNSQPKQEDGWVGVFLATCSWCVEGPEWAGGAAMAHVLAKRGARTWYKAGLAGGWGTSVDAQGHKLAEAIANWWVALFAARHGGAKATRALCSCEGWVGKVVVRHALAWLSQAGPLGEAGMRLFGALDEHAGSGIADVFDVGGGEGAEEDDDDSDDELMEVAPVVEEGGWREEGMAYVLGELVKLGRQACEEDRVLGGEGDVGEGQGEVVEGLVTRTAIRASEDVLAALQGEGLGKELLELVRGHLGMHVCVQIAAFSVLARRLALLNSIEWEVYAHEQDEEEEGVKAPIRRSRVFPSLLIQLIACAGQWGAGRRVSGQLEGAVLTTEAVGVLLGWLLLLSMYDSHADDIRTLARKLLGDKHLFPPILALAMAHLSHEEAPTELLMPMRMGMLLDGSAAGACQLAGHVVLRSVELVPSLVRSWFTELSDRAGATVVEKFVASAVTPVVLSREVSGIDEWKGDDDLEIKAVLGGREIRAKYQKDEGSLELVIHVPSCYPLKAVTIDPGKRIAVSEAKWRKWQLAIYAHLTHHQGTLLDAVLLWKGNIDAVFEGVEECPICYSVIHIVNSSLPKLTCHTCNHKFHSACLYKWFNSSNKSQCPLCQSPW